MKLSGWGQYPVIDTHVQKPKSLKELCDAVIAGNTIPRGNGRSYGDSAIGKTNTIDMRNFNRVLEFNSETGLLVAESGLLLSDIIDKFLQKGWFPLVTPGTKFVTLGGLVAADVHGKNHHKDGSFCACLSWIEILDKNGELKKCSRNKNKEMFFWTVGGMGLTGTIVKVALYLQPVSSAWIKQETIPAKNISHAIEIFEKRLETKYSVAWIDCSTKKKNLGRSLVYLGEHALASDLRNDKSLKPLETGKHTSINVPFNLPPFVLNKFSIRIFNKFYFWLGTKKQKKLVSWNNYFYPLDRLRNWNRIYGKRGFAQFQCVIPLKNALCGMQELLETISECGASSFLGVLKRLGDQEGYISFPMKGYTLALDFPITRENLELMKRLDQITIKYGGRFYLAKDSRMSSTVFKNSDPRFINLRKFIDENIGHTYKSVQSERLDL
ncbi:MAG: FAD-linked oxidase [Rhodospirillaceae bacterium]|nr:FAD-linked oxidase [Rhodospirillaceae bacterium]